ncbi:hypothetical protein AX17_003306 [Amanita inopinata Kibby_2008]|nr:hypothetical protein AX17_003306 [Amanita inopinata Kibby_2008]
MEIKEVLDPHEILYHSLKVIEDSLALDRGPPPRGYRQITYSAQSVDSSRINGDLSLSRESNLRHNLPPDRTGNTTRSDFAPDDISYGTLSASVHEQDSPVQRQTVQELEGRRMEQEDWFSSETNVPRPPSSATTSSYHTASSQPSSPPRPFPRYHEEAADHQSGYEITNRPAYGAGVSSPVEAHTRLRHTSLHRDPYGNLTSLQRDIMGCIHQALVDASFPSIYGTSSWEGVDIKIIVNALRMKHGEGLVISEVE